MTLVFYASISIQLRTITVYQPSLPVYERLYDQHSFTLTCPCTDLSISYQQIMSVQPRYHQVCSSDFIKDNAWLLYFSGLNSVLYTLDFRATGVRLFILLQTLCRMSNEIVKNELNVFHNTQFVSGEVLSKDTFNIQTSGLIRQFQQQVFDSERFIYYFS